MKIFFLPLFKNIKPYLNFLFLTIIIFIGYWQLFLFNNTMKWDIIDINLPWRYFLSECINNNVLPLWNPFINSGFYQGGDTMTWYPISWFVGLIFNNTLITLQYEFVFHILIGSFGVFKLLTYLKIDKTSSLIMSISFSMSGLFVSNAQHFGWIVSASWFSLIILYYLKFINNLKIVDGFLFVLFLYFLFSGGYPGFFIITIYLISVLFIIELIKRIKNKTYNFFLLKNLLLFIVFILISLVLIVSLLEINKTITVANRLSPDYCIMGALPIKALLSFLLPYSTTSNPETWNADNSLINCYIGLIPLVFIIYGLIYSKNKNIKIYFIIGVFFLTIAIADIFPFRKILYYLPLMDKFRFPTIFRFFAYSFFLLSAAISLKEYFLKKIDKYLLFLIILFLTFFASIAFYSSFFIEKWKFKLIFTKSFLEFDKISTIQEKLFLQAAIVILLLSIFFISILKFQNKFLKIIIVLLVSFDMIISLQLNTYHTVIDPTNPKATQKAIENIPKGFHIPDLQEKIININDITAKPIPYLWRNINIFHKKTSFTGYSPYSYQTMDSSLKHNQFYPIINNPLLFLCDSLSNNNIIDTNSIDTLSYQKIRIKNFNPNKIELITNTDHLYLLTYVQNYFTGWNAYINYNKEDIIITNKTFISIWLPKGENIVTYEFRPKKIIIAYNISFYSFMITLLLIFILIIYRKNKKI